MTCPARAVVRALLEMGSTTVTALPHRAEAGTVGVIVEQALAPVPGGTGRYTVEVTAALARTQPQRTVRSFTAWHRDVSAARIPRVVGPARLPVGRRTLSRLWQRGAQPAIRGVDVLHAPTLLAPRRHNGPLVVTIHDAVPWTHPETLTAHGAAWHRTAAANAAAHAQAIVVPTAAVRDELHEHLQPRCPVHVVPLGVSPELNVPSDAAERVQEHGIHGRYVVSVATLEPRKGLDVLLTALARPETGDIQLVVIGAAGWGDVDLDQTMRDVGLSSDRVHVLGRVSDADMCAVVGQALAAVVPSRAEGFGLPVIEAMSLGTPVIHSDAPALVEVAGDAGRCVPRDDPATLAAAIADIAANPHEAAALSEAGLARAGEFDWDRTAQRLWQLYDDLVTQGAS